MNGNFNTRQGGLAVLGLAVFGLTACGDEVKSTNVRGMGSASIMKPGSKPAGPDSKARAGSRRSAPDQAKPGAAAKVETPRPPRPHAVLTRDDFSGDARDPFHNYLAAEVVDLTAPIDVVRGQREVRMAEYSFDELRLIAIVNAGRGVAPRALFLSGDNKSKSIKQGEYFSSAEVLLASVNRDYIEIEVVDPELTPGWNLERGERKVIYLTEK